MFLPVNLNRRITGKDVAEFKIPKCTNLDKDFHFWTVFGFINT
jgi:hypothetical protein